MKRTDMQRIERELKRVQKRARIGEKRDANRPPQTIGAYIKGLKELLRHDGETIYNTLDDEEILELLENMGFRVISERTFEAPADDGVVVFIHDMELEGGLVPTGLVETDRPCIVVALSGIGRLHPPLIQEQIVFHVRTERHSAPKQSVGLLKGWPDAPHERVTVSRGGYCSLLWKPQEHARRRLCQSR